MAFTFTIAGASKSLQPGWRITENLNGRNVMTFSVLSLDGTYRPASRAEVIFSESFAVVSSSVANPTVITTSEAHGIATGQTVTIAGHSGSTPAINNSYVATRISATQFSVPVNVTVGGTGGTVSRRLFAGTVQDADEAGLGGYGVTPIVTTVSAVDYNALPDRRQVEFRCAAGSTLKQALTIVTSYLSGFGVTLSASQVDGPTFDDALVFELGPLTAVLEKLSVITGYAWDISYEGVLSMTEPGTVAAPFGLSAGDGHAIGDITVAPSLSDYANTVIVRFTESARPAYAQLFASGNAANNETVTVGSKTYTFKTAVTGGDDVDGNVKVGADAEESLTNLVAAITLGGTPGTEYAAAMTVNAIVTAYLRTPDTVTVTALTAGVAGNSVVCSEATANLSWITEGGGSTATLQFGADDSLTATATATSSPAAADVVEVVIAHPEVRDQATAQALAYGYLTRLLVTPKEIRYKTLTAGIHPGQSQSIVEARRNLNGSCLVTSVDITANGNVLWYDVTAVDGLVITPSFRETYKSWGGGGGGGGNIGIATPVGGGSTTVYGIAPTVNTVLGNLNGYYGYAANTFGFASGDPSGCNITIDSTNGIRIRYGTTDKLTADVSGNLSITGNFTVGTAGIIRSGATDYATGTGYVLDYNGGTPRVRFGTVSGDRLTWDGTNLTIVSANMTADASGVRVAPDLTGAYNNAHGFGFGPLSYGGSVGLFATENASARNVAVTNSVTGALNTASSVLSAANSTNGTYASIQVLGDKSILVFGNTDHYGNLTVANGTVFGFGAGNLSIAGDVAVNTNKFTVAASTGNTVVAGTLAVTGDVAINTNKFTVTATSGDTVVAGTLGVTGVATFTAVPVFSSGITEASITDGTILARLGSNETVTGAWHFDNTSLIVGDVRQWYHSEASSISWWVNGAAQAGSGIAAATSTLYFRANSETVASITDTVADFSGVYLAVTGGGIVAGAPTGGDKGAGTANFAADIYKNNTAFTNPKWALQHYFKGTVDAEGPYAAPADYTGLMPIEAHREATSAACDLPLMLREINGGIFARGDMLLASLEEAYLYIYQLHDRIKALEARDVTR